MTMNAEEFQKILMHNLRKITKNETILERMGVEKVIFNDNATIVILTTGEKGVAIKSKSDEYDSTVGFAMAYAYAVADYDSKAQFKKELGKIVIFDL